MTCNRTTTQIGARDVVIFHLFWEGHQIEGRGGLYLDKDTDKWEIRPLIDNSKQLEGAWKQYCNLDKWMSANCEEWKDAYPKQ